MISFNDSSMPAGLVQTISHLRQAKRKNQQWHDGLCCRSVAAALSNEFDVLPSSPAYGEALGLRVAPAASDSVSRSSFEER